MTVFRVLRFILRCDRVRAILAINQIWPVHREWSPIPWPPGTETPALPKTILPQTQRPPPWPRTESRCPMGMLGIPTIAHAGQTFTWNPLILQVQGAKQQSSAERSPLKRKDGAQATISLPPHGTYKLVALFYFTNIFHIYAYISILTLISPFFKAPENNHFFQHFWNFTPLPPALISF